METSVQYFNRGRCTCLLALSILFCLTWYTYLQGSGSGTVVLIYVWFAVVVIRPFGGMPWHFHGSGHGNPRQYHCMPWQPTTAHGAPHGKRQALRQATASAPVRHGKPRKCHGDPNASLTASQGKSSTASHGSTHGKPREEKPKI